jgi:hypothetical protein
MKLSPMLVVCRLGLHSWPRVHGDWREPVVAPAEASCLRCNEPIKSIWRTVYPRDGSRCRPSSCDVHVPEKSQDAPSSSRSGGSGLLPTNDETDSGPLGGTSRSELRKKVM